MAKLSDLVESLNVTMPKPEKPSGAKRRSWLIDDENEKGSINPIYKPDLSIPSIKPIDETVSSNPLINTIHEPQSTKRVINPIKKPLDIGLDKLRGNPLKIAQYIFDNIKQTSDLVTEKMTSLEIMNSLEISKDSVRTALRFLLKNNLIKRVYFEIGKHGFSKYELKRSLFDEIKEGYIKGSIHPIQVKGFNNSSSINDTITTKYKPLLGQSLPNEWLKIDYSPLKDLEFGETQLRQIYKSNKMTPDILQDSINRFAYSLKYSDKVKNYTNPIYVFMGLMLEGERWNEPNYKSPKELALHQLLEEKKKEKERSHVMLEELFNLEYPEWRKNLTEEQIKEIVSPDSWKLNIQSAVESELKIHFKEKILLK